MLLTWGWLVHRLCITLIPAILLFATIVSKRHSRWRNWFQWRYWMLPFLAIAIFSLAQWRFDADLNFTTYQVIQFRWQWAAIFEWALLFILLLLTYRHRLPMVDVVAFSWCCVLLASILYEIPWHVRFLRLEFLYYAKFHLGLIGVVGLLYRSRYRRSWHLWIGILSVVVGWLVYPPYGIFHILPPGSYWLPRLTVYPFFLSFAWGLRHD